MFCSHEFEKKQLVIKAGNLLSERGLVERTWGNVSVRIDEDCFAISPTGASYINLKPEDIPIVDLKHLTFVGARKPSSELLIHSSIYNYYPKVSFVLHTHQRFASLLSLFFNNQQGRVVVSNKYRSILGNTISSAKYAEAGTEEIAKNVIQALSSKYSSCASRGVVLMVAHGVICFANSFDEAFNMVQLLEEFAKNLVLTTLKNNGVFLESHGELHTYTRTSMFKQTMNPTINKLCSFIFKEAIDVSFVTLSTLPISQYISKTLQTRIFTHITKLFQGVPAYFDDVAQIIGESAILISDADSFLQNNFARLIETYNTFIVAGIGVLYLSQKEDETIYMASVFEKNALAFLLSLYNPDILPLTKENAISLHTSFMQGYSKLKNT